MTTDISPSTAASLQRAFDRSFAEAPTEVQAMESFLAIRVGGDPYAVRLSEIVSLHADRRVIPIPSRMSELLGLVGLRGAMAPVYDLRALLGGTGGPAPRWLLVVRAPHLVGFAFDLVDAHVRTSISVTENGGSPLPCLRGVVRVADVVRPLIHVASLIEMTTTLTQACKSPKEP